MSERRWYDVLVVEPTQDQVNRDPWISLRDRDTGESYRVALTQDVLRDLVDQYGEQGKEVTAQTG